MNTFFVAIFVFILFFAVFLGATKLLAFVSRKRKGTEEQSASDTTNEGDGDNLSVPDSDRRLSRPARSIRWCHRSDKILSIFLINCGTSVRAVCHSSSIWMVAYPCTRTCLILMMSFHGMPGCCSLKSGDSIYAASPMISTFLTTAK